MGEYKLGERVRVQWGKEEREIPAERGRASGRGFGVSSG